MPAFVQRIWGYVIAALAAVATVALVYLGGRSAGGADERQKRNDRINEQRQRLARRCAMCKTKWPVWTMMLFLIASSLTRCAAPARVCVEFCDYARPVSFDSERQVDENP
jgi:hypothetical protein